MDPDIEFTFEGKNYTVGYEAYNLDRIELPDGRLLAVDGWKEAYPPIPMKLRVINRRKTEKHFAHAALAELKP